MIKWDYDNPLDYWLTAQSTYVYWIAPVVGQTKIVQEYSRLSMSSTTRNEPIRDE